MNLHHSAKWTCRLVIAFAFSLSATAFSEVPESKLNYKVEDVRAAVEKLANSKKTKETAAALAKPEVQAALTRYMGFLQIDPKDDVEFGNVFNRLINSSTQMIFCDDVNDWECLEEKPQVTPVSDFRRDVKPDLGVPVKTGEALKVETFFTRRWADLLRKQPIAKTTLADQLGKEIHDRGTHGVYMALYGIDDLEGSMSPVYKAIEERIKAKTTVEGVFDVADDASPGNFLRQYDVDVTTRGLKISAVDELDFSYVKPHSQQKWVWGHPRWMDEILNMDPKTESIKADENTGSSRILADVKWLMNPAKATDAVRMGFQYSETVNLIRLLNDGLEDNDKAPARIEFPMQAIMHNKFLVLDSGKEKSVWTGTANVSRTCMGEESNSNMSILINSTDVANAFQDEFNEMHEFDPENGAIERAKHLVTGRFHRFKRPNTKRYFVFNDGNEVRVHFAPTDDGEHRAILPMLLSAKKGDVIRVSMFSGAGIELVRAMQFAASRGVKVKVLLDNKSGTIGNGWIRDEDGNLFDKNPYSAKPTKIEVHVSAWLKNGLNHYKAATLSRGDGNEKYRTEVFIVGSQNWSALGNDSNDENMVTIRNLKKSVEAGDSFNEEFDNTLWPLSAEVSSLEELNSRVQTNANKGSQSSSQD